MIIAEINKEEKGNFITTILIPFSANSK